MGLCEHWYSCDCDDPANLCKQIHKLQIHVNIDAEIINEIDMTDGFECFPPSNDIKENRKPRLKN